MSVRRLSAAGLVPLHRAVNDPATVERFRSRLCRFSAAQNRREWVIRRLLAGNPLADPRGPRRRARELRDLARQDQSAVAADVSRLRERIGEQLPLW